MKKFLLLVVYFGVIGALAALSLWWALVTVGRGEYLTAGVVLGFGVSFVGIAAALVLILAGKVSPRIEFDADGTTIRCDRLVDGLNVWSTVAVWVAMATYAIFALQHELDIPPPPGSHRNFPVIALVLSLLAIPQLWKMFKRGGLSFLRMTPNGFELGQGVSSVHGEWDDVVDMADRRAGKARPLRATMFVKFRDGRTRSQAIDSYTPRGEAMRRLVRYYWINEDQRAELTDGRAIARLEKLASD